LRGQLLVKNDGKVGNAEAQDSSIPDWHEVVITFSYRNPAIFPSKLSVPFRLETKYLEVFEFCQIFNEVRA
jgi:hypothetical protein